MIVRQLSPSGDFTFGKGLSNYLSGNAAIRQNIQTRLSFFLGDCFFDPTSGIDWWNLLGNKSLTSILLAVNNCIVNTNGVTGLLQSNVNLDTNTRNLTISYSCTTVYSTLTSTYQYTFII